MAGMQIDLLFERDDHVLMLCEIKSGASMDRKVLDEVKEKKKRLKTAYSRHTILPVLIYDGEISETIRASEVFHKT
jgi:hypothetical protein